MKGIVPGEYVALAWEQVETAAAEDPEFRKPFESKAVAVKFSEGSTETRPFSPIFTAFTPRCGRTVP